MAVAVATAAAAAVLPFDRGCENCGINRDQATHSRLALASMGTSLSRWRGKYITYY